MTRPTRARIDLAALRHNARVAREQAHGAKLWAVLKADAYGHGLLPLAQALNGIADGFAVIELEGALALREAGLHEPILLLEGFYDADELVLFAEHGLTAMIHSLWQIEVLLAARLPMAIDLCLKLETGMHRLGLQPDEFTAALALLHRAQWAGALTLVTHFADADGGEGIEAQLRNFERITAGVNLPRSIANSAALLRFPEAVGGAGNWVRPGIMLYGASPCPALRSAADYGLQPVMTLESRVIATKTLAPGDAVGYGGLFVAERPMRIGVIACGYADGYPRHAPTGTPLLVDGKRTRLLGRVSMDKICVDLTDLPEVGAGGTAVMWGRDAASGAVLPADEVATAAGTIAYQLFCNLGSRVAVDYL
jgi:alanine racemase